MGKIFAILIIILMGCASIGYAFSGDYKMSVYWGGLMVVNSMVTF